MDDWHDKMERVMKKNPDYSYWQHRQLTSNVLSRDNAVLNHNNKFCKPSRWDCLQGTHTSQSKSTTLYIFLKAKRYRDILLIYSLST